MHDNATQLPLFALEKRCTRCGIIRPLSDFHRNKNKKDGRVFQCKACACAATRQWLAANPDRAKETAARYYEQRRDTVREKVRQYQQQNAEKIREAKRRHRLTNRDQLRESSASYYREHAEEIKQRRRNYYRANRERSLESVRRYRAANPEKVRERHQRWRWKNIDSWRARSLADAHRRNARKRNVGGSFTPQEWQAILNRFGHKCLRCGKPQSEVKLTIDHVVPIALGGRNDASNLQPLCGPCNFSKGARIADYRGGVD